MWMSEWYLKLKKPPFREGLHVDVYLWVSCWGPFDGHWRSGLCHQWSWRAGQAIPSASRYSRATWWKLFMMTKWLNFKYLTLQCLRMICWKLDSLGDLPYAGGWDYEPEGYPQIACDCTSPKTHTFSPSFSPCMIWPYSPVVLIIAINHHFLENHVVLKVFDLYGVNRDVIMPITVPFL